MTRFLLLVTALILPGRVTAQTSAATGAPPSDRQQVLDVAQKFFDALAANDADALRRLVIPGTQVTSARATVGAFAVSRRVIEDDVARWSANRDRYLERIWNPTVLVHGRIATVWAPYDFHLNGRFSHTGIDVFNLLKTDGGWKISGLAYSVEPDVPSTHPAGPPPPAGHDAVAEPPRTAARATSCALSLTEPSTFVSLPSHPFQALPSADGCWLFAAQAAAAPGLPGGIAVLRNVEGSFRLDHVMPIAGNPTGMVLTHDGTLLIVANGRAVTFVDVGRLTTTRTDAVVGAIAEGREFGRIYVNVTKDDRHLFVANERTASVTVIDLAKARATSFAASSVIGEIPTGRAPIALIFSNDERLLYVTSQEAPASVHWPAECRPQGAAANANAPDHRPGAINVVDVARAGREPARSVVSVIRAGCNPVRLALSPDGHVAYVTARTDDAVLVFDARRFVGDTAGALIATVPVGTAPVGVAVVNDGATVLVTNSNRFASGADDRQSVTVIDAGTVRRGAAAVVGSVPAGAFPREMRLLPGGRALVLTNFNSNSIQIIDLARLPRAK